MPELCALSSASPHTIHTQSCASVQGSAATRCRFVRCGPPSPHGVRAAARRWGRRRRRSGTPRGVRAAARRWGRRRRNRSGSATRHAGRTTLRRSGRGSSGIRPTKASNGVSPGCRPRTAAWRSRAGASRRQSACGWVSSYTTTRSRRGARRTAAASRTGHRGATAPTAGVAGEMQKGSRGAEHRGASRAARALCQAAKAPGRAPGAARGGRRSTCRNGSTATAGAARQTGT